LAEFVEFSLALIAANHGLLADSLDHAFLQILQRVLAKESRSVAKLLLGIEKASGE
jgi:hypothetical protein